MTMVKIGAGSESCKNKQRMASTGVQFKLAQMWCAQIKGKLTKTNKLIN